MKLILLMGTGILVLMFSSCNRSEMRLASSYERMVIPGQPNRKGYLESVITFKKNKNDNIVVNKVELLSDNKQEMLIFIKPTLTDTAFSRTYSSTVGLQEFTLILPHNKVSEKNDAGMDIKPAAQIFYDQNGKGLTLIIQKMGPRKTVRLR